MGKKTCAAVLVVSAGMFASCASMRSNDLASNESAEVGESNDQLKAKISELEQQVTDLRTKLKTAQTQLDHLAPLQQTAFSTIKTHPAEGKGVSPGNSPQHEKETDFTENEATQTFRNALILFDAEKYSESILAFTGFLKEHKDHPLAGSAQFHIGEAYFSRNEWKLAHEEYTRLLVAYDRSSYVSDALKRMVQIETKLNLTDAAALHRQQLLSLFPQSNAAQNLEVPQVNSVAPAENREPQSIPTAPIPGTDPT